MTHPTDSFLFRSADLRTATCADCGRDLDPRSLDDDGLCDECARAAVVRAARAAGELGELLPSAWDSPEVAAELRNAAAEVSL